MCLPLLRNSRKQYYTTAFDNNNKFFGCKEIERDNKQKKEAKEEDRQGADVKKKKN